MYKIGHPHFVKTNLLKIPRLGREVPIGTFWQPTKEFIKELSGDLKGKRVLEIFAGNGLLSGLLSKEGIDAIPTSILSSMDGHEYGTYAVVENLDAVSSVMKYGTDSDVLLMCWPTTTEHAIKAVRLWGRGKDIIFIGEVTDYSKGHLGGCATDAFFEETVFVKRFDSYAPRNILEQAVVYRLK